MGDNLMDYLQGRGQNFNAYSAGNKVFNGSSNAPNRGPIADKTGYVERDNKAKGMREALLRRIKANQSGHYFSSAAMTPPRNLFAGPGGN